MENIQNIDQLDYIVTDAIKRNYSNSRLSISLSNLFNIAREEDSTSFFADEFILLYVLGRVKTSIPTHRWKRSELKSLLKRIGIDLKPQSKFFKEFIK